MQGRNAVQGRIDERGLRGLMEQSGDLQSDAMKLARGDLDGYVEAAWQARIDGVLDAKSPAGTSPDVKALQTAAGIENLAVTTYKTALTLPFIGGSSANGVVKAFAQMTMKQHADHGQAFNAAVARLGGKAQMGTDPKYTPVVTKAVPSIKSALDVVGLAITLEDVAAQTYVKDVGLVSTSELRQLFGSVAGVESQHKAVLLAVQALLKGNAPQLIALPPEAAKLPAAAGKVGFPDAFYPTVMAAPISEGAVK